MSQNTPIILILPEARAALAAEVKRSGMTGDLSGGLLFGYPLDETQRLIVSSTRLGAEVGFGRRDFSLDQTRTSRQLAHAQSLDPKATYCGIWFLHRTPNWELSDKEWVQTQTLLDDPDFAFDDLVCLVLCFYYAELEIYASCFNRYQSARGQAPTPTELRLTTETVFTPTAPTPGSPPAPSLDWYRAPEVAARLDQEHQRLATRYEVETALGANKQMFFRLSPKHKYEKLQFYIAVGDGFPENAPNVFLLVGGKPHRLSTPGVVSWSANKSLVDLADELVEWLVFSVGEYMRTAEEALTRERFEEAADWLRLVLAIEPRTPGAARLLAKAERIG